MTPCPCWHAAFFKNTSPGDRCPPADPSGAYLRGDRRVRGSAPEVRQRTWTERYLLGGRVAKLEFFVEFCKFLVGSFSAVSKRKFARKYSLESSWRDLQDLHAFAPLRPQYLSKFSSRIFEIFSQFFRQHRQNCSMFVPIRAETSPNFVGISQIIQKMASKCCKMPKIWRKQRKFWTRVRFGLDSS